MVYALFNFSQVNSRNRDGLFVSDVMRFVDGVAMTANYLYSCAMATSGGHYWLIYTMSLIWILKNSRINFETIFVRKHLVSSAC